MHYTKPKVFLIAKPSICEVEMREWLDHIGANNYSFHKSSSDAEDLIMAAAKRCYMAFEPGLNPNVQKVRENVTEYIDNILKSGHGSVLEHASFTFAIEGVSRVFTGEMNRHRAGMAISEGSMRFISFEDLGLVKTKGLEEPENLNFNVSEYRLAHDYLIDVFIKKTFSCIEDLYIDLMRSLEVYTSYSSLSFSIKKILTSRIRRAIPMGISTGGIWTGNVRALRHICELRGTEYAEEEILEVSQLILQKMMKECPNLFGDFTADERGFYAPKYSKV